MRAVVDPVVESTIGAYFSALNARDMGRWLTLFADDAVSHDPVGAPPAEGRDTLQEIWKAITSPLSKLEITPGELFQGGSGAAVWWSARAVGVNNREVEFAGIYVFELNADGLIQTLMAYWDPAAMLLELAGEEGA
jgi:steroid delta-isomerase